MSDWLESELSRGLGKVAAPETLGERLGFSRPVRREFPGPVLAVAAAVVMIVAAGYAASTSRTLDLYPPPAKVALIAWNGDDAALRCDGGAGVTVPLRNANATELLAHHGGSLDRLPAVADAGCRFCHSL